MKQLLSIVFLFVYIASTAGVSLQLHYCHGFVSNVNIGYSVDDLCVCDTKTDMHCCDDEFKYLKLDEKHLTKTLLEGFSIQQIALLYSYKLIHLPETSQVSVDYIYSSIPPPNNVSHQALLSVFII